jgi:putative pyoverdin transport system ATP-binding/permease protein
MEYFRFLQKESAAINRHLIVAALFAGILNMALIFLLTLAAGKAARGTRDFSDLLKVALCLWSFWVSKGYLMRRMTTIVEGVLKNVRQRLVEKVRDSDLRSLETVGRAPLYNVISTHANTISRASTGIISGATSLVLLICVFFIILSLSVTAFLIVVGTLACLVLVFQINQARVAAAMTEVNLRDNDFVHGFGDLFDGFKELKMDSAKNREFVDDYLLPKAEKAELARIKAGLIFNRSILVANVAMFILLASVVFIVPVFAPTQVSNIFRITTLIVFMFGPLGEVVGVYPFFNEALAAIKEIQRIEGHLDSVYELGLEEPTPVTTAVLTFDTIRCDRIAFSYRDELGRESFSLIPFNFQLSKGELVFITGGNGSGKSTFLKVLAGLYSPASGDITVNDVPIGPLNRQAYRNLFEPIFSDFHLFDRIYGLQEVDETRLNQLLTLTGLTHKTSIADRSIATINLSSGERKRLALVLCLLENKPIFLLDEWAAEQDPQFRRKFYREILPDLKRQGKTGVVVTHDDDYYDVADRLLKMQFGNFVSM